MTRLIKTDRQWYGKGQYIAYPAPWSVAEDDPVMRSGRDYLDTMRITEATFPHETDIAWHWPLPFRPGVRGYPALSFGSVAGGIPRVPVAPKRVRDITSFSSSADISYMLASGAAQGLEEFYAQRSAVWEKDPQSRLEIGWFRFAPEETTHWCGQGKPVGGTFQASIGPEWRVGMQTSGNSRAFVTAWLPDGQEYLSGGLQHDQLLAFLKGKGVITGDEIVTGVASGIEPLRGAGAARYRRFTGVLR